MRGPPTAPHTKTPSNGVHRGGRTDGFTSPGGGRALGSHAVTPRVPLMSLADHYYGCLVRKKVMYLEELKMGTQDFGGCHAVPVCVPSARTTALGRVPSWGWGMGQDPACVTPSRMIWALFGTDPMHGDAPLWFPSWVAPGAAPCPCR